ncbi:MAG TPA: RsmB/NOP family class I SAM-dependent RNA methyltransferase [Alphaproteobacteria bacterium]|nr:RsmB/NOP family class I SAM-dependent RNA methyltransferase [Alphaproteobacteria bacterium]
MTPAARIQAAIELLGILAPRKRPADQVVSDYFRQRRYIGAKDRRTIAELVYGIIRRQARLDWWRERGGGASVDRARALILTALAVIDSWSVDRIAAVFDGKPYHPASLTADERRLALAVQGHTLDHPAQPDWVRLEVPSWLLPKLAEAWGPRLPRELAALQDEAPFDLRSNTLKGTRDAARAALKAEGVDAAPTPLSPIGLRLDARIAIAATEAFRSGLVEVQDEGSQIVALLTDAKPGQRVCDFCAGAGGKTLALAAAMENRGQIMALDIRDARIARAALRLRRGGIHNVARRLLEGHRDPWVKRHKGSFDRVLVDAPCTGIGTWRRNPDAKWRIGPEDLTELTALQADILASASRLVRPGGRLVYATCSVLPEENQLQLPRFLAAHPDFHIVPVAGIWRATIGGTCPATEATLALTPAHHGTDGFFVAIFERG